MAHFEVELIDEATVVKTAQILGRKSAAQRALDDASARRSRGEDVIFARRGDVLYVADRSSFSQLR